MTKDMPEFSNTQLERIDEIYGAVYQMLMTIAERDDLEWDMACIGPVAEYACRLLHERGHSIYFPTRVEDDDEVYITDSYMP